MGFSDRDYEMCTWANLEEEGGPDSFHHLGTPQSRAGKGRVRSTAVLPGMLEQVVSLGPEDWLEIGVFFSHCIHLSSIHHLQHQTQLRAPCWEWRTWR